MTYPAEIQKVLDGLQSRITQADTEIALLKTRLATWEAYKDKAESELKEISWATEEVKTATEEKI